MINAEWHKNNKMPKNPTQEQRIKWHIQHQANCKCRQMPEKLKKLINEYQSKQTKQQS